APSGVHIAFGTRDDEMSVTWHTLASNPGDAVVEYSLLSDVSASSRVEGTTRAFVDGGPERSVRFVHRVVLSNLEPGATYKYRVGNPATKAYSVWFDFVAKRSRAQIAAGPPLKLLALCDQGHRESAGVLQLVAAEVADPSTRPDALVHCGDFAYDLDTYSGRNGDRFLADIEPVAARVPYMTSQGNHERAYNFSHYAERFTMPGAGASNGNAYYSFDVGPMHVVAFNAEAFFWPEFFDATYRSRMYEWLVDDLRAANDNRGNVPWILVHGHRPMYCVDAKVPDLTPHADKPEFDGSPGDFPIEKALYENGVDLYLAGHVHDYERYFPAFDERVVNGTDVTLERYVNPGATVHVTSGSGGNPEMWT
ncbi:predicted protein, partial [Micromonas commoda]